ncbi:MAG: hypothetical protein HN981_01945 [Candidatus Pacebacteria bacterium]|jgi:hypothetical protein|nr:hypothetical protein [Candidatus Paceibacterota bacterium]MBT4652768.1 hypothetical protein [Candidatus Paceibacterota bacterium]MBT6755925.1 hypothetical protein [Candidatus Paceibacterota bacterium]MBT6921138.1 hypothetical protein [Candidatus Paceibacterota bacterium]
MTEQKTPNMGAVPHVSEMPPSPTSVTGGDSFFKKATKNWKAMLGGVLGLAVVASSGYWVYANYFMSPERMLKEAAENFEVESIKVGFEASDEQVDISGVMIAHEEGYSSVDFKLGLTEEGITHDFDMNFVVDMENMYFQMDYSLMEMILMQADIMIPGISNTKTYALLKPVMTGESWLHMDIPEEDRLSSDEDIDEYMEEWEEFGEEFVEALVIKDFKRNEEYKNKKYNIISLGFDKEKLLEAIDSIKDLDIKADIADINTFKKSIEDMGELKETIMVVYIDSAGYIRMVDLYAPQGSSDSIQEAINEESSTKSPLLAQFSKATSFFQPDKDAKEGESIKFMTMTFDDYGSAKMVSAPSPTVEWEDVLKYGQEELMPIFYQYMMMQQGANPAMMQQAPQNPGMGTYPGMVPQQVPGNPGMMFSDFLSL